MTRNRHGFSLVELMITLTVLAVVVTALMVVMVGSQRSKAATEALVEAQQSGRLLLDIISRDVRSAGFTVDEDATPPQPAFAYVDSVELILNANLQPFVLGSSAEPSRTQPPLALDPNGTPLPAKITGPYVPPMKFRTGAEMIRYTLDLTNDGIVDASDQAHAAAGEAIRSANPNDFVLARMVYGDSSGSTPVAGFNGGAVEKLGLVRGPGAGVPNLFTVYLGSNPLPWNWANGPVPADRLDEISRITINVTTESRRPDGDGNYVRSTLTSEVNSIRNVPEAAFTSYTADGYVFEDVNMNGARDLGEPGLPNVTLRMGSSGFDQTDANGYYFMQVPPGQYTLKQDVPEGYGAFTPDSVLVDFVTNPTDFTHDFADTAKVGGWVIDTCWVDTNDDGVRDPDEFLQDGVQITVGSQTKITNGAGHAQFFVSPGSFSVSAVTPESLVVKSANPVSISVADGDTVRVDFALGESGTGTVSGKVFLDTNRNGSFDTGESGVNNIWVAVTKNSGSEVLGFEFTSASGEYEISVPSNLPEATTPYQVTFDPPPGFYPTGSAVLGPVWVADGDNVPNQNFGVQSFQVITLNAERVLSLGSAELMEKDWNGNTKHSTYLSKGRQDADLVLGSEWSANPNISVWFNEWDNTPLFQADPTYQRNAFASALSVAVGPLDDDSPWNRPDVVTGLESYASGNLAVWLTQNTDGNFGFLPDSPTYYMTQDGGDVNAVVLSDVDGDGDRDVVVGTKSGTNSGTIEVWLNANGVLTREVTFPPNGGVSSLGEVRDIGLGDFDDDGDLDLVAVTKENTLQGKIYFFEKLAAWPWYARVWDSPVWKNGNAGEGQALAVLDVNGDGRVDVITGTRTGSSGGELQHWNRMSSSPFDVEPVREIVAPGVVLSLHGGDFGGLAGRKDVAVGYRDNESGFAGGVRIYFLDGGTLPTKGSDPSGGAVNFMVPALDANDYNFGNDPTPAPPYLTDLSAAMKSGPTTGALLVFIR